MNLKLSQVKEFSSPYYEGKDMMHNLWHIELVYRSVLDIVERGKYEVNKDALMAATYFHGFVKTHEHEIKEWLISEGVSEVEISNIILIAHESHTTVVPTLLEGKILHDAHLIEGGKTYMITKCLITGSLRGQTLPETISYIENHIIDKRVCYLPQSKVLFEEATTFTKEFLHDLKKGIL